jgi:lipoyl(octanoyl) transferase
MSEVKPDTTLSDWDYLGLSEDSGPANMSCDRKLLDELQSGERRRPAVRLYLWKTPTISLGTNQTSADVVVQEQVGRLGYDIVKRPTGGRALLHKGDICYAISAHKSHHPSFHSLTSTYRAIGAVLSETLESLGIGLAELPALGSDSRRSLNPCFAMLSPFEVTVKGKKICGSAQFRSGGFFFCSTVRFAFAILGILTT